MNKIKYALVALSLLLTLPAALTAQRPYIHQISVDHLEVRKATDIVTVQMEIVLDGLHLRSNDLLRLSPALRMKDSGEVVELLPPVQIEGRKRSIVQERKASTGIRDEWDTEALQSLRRKNGTAQRVTYSYTIPPQGVDESGRPTPRGACLRLLRLLQARGVAGAPHPLPHRPLRAELSALLYRA